MHYAIILLVYIVIVGLLIYLIFLIIKALRLYIKSKEVRDEKSELKQSLGENIKTARNNSRITQEFVAESLGVSRQAVSKWETGQSEPSTSNLILLAKLFEVDIKELI